MITQIARYFSAAADWKLLIAAILLYIFFGAYIMPNGAQKIRDLSGGKEVEILDLQFAYSPDSARAYLAEYTPEARDFAIKFGLGADFFYPMAYTFLLVVIVALIYKSPEAKTTVWRNIHLFPFAVLLVDYFENIGIASLHFNYPDVADWQVRVASSLTSLKWSLFAAVIAIVVWGFIRKFTAKKAL
jgi:hypothetical protein